MAPFNSFGRLLEAKRLLQTSRPFTDLDSCVQVAFNLACSTLHCGDLAKAQEMLLLATRLGGSTHPPPSRPAYNLPPALESVDPVRTGGIHVAKWHLPPADGLPWQCIGVKMGALENYGVFKLHSPASCHSTVTYHVTVDVATAAFAAWRWLSPGYYS